MAYNWSISTTLRNPERMIDWLKVVNENLIGEGWNEDTQIRLQILLIQEKLYKPLDLTANEKKIYEDFNLEFSFEEAETIFNRQNYTDPAMRGRNSLSPLKKMGLIKISNDIISITSLGDYLLSDDYDFGYFLFRVFLKWEYRNPSERTTNSSFNINPFIATLHLINKVNNIAKNKNELVKGISKDEFMIFVQTLTNYENIDNYAQRLYDYRLYIKTINDNTNLSHQEKENLKKIRKIEILKILTNESDKNKLEKLLQNLKDYTDNTIRYFRATRYLYIRGGGYYIDLEPRRNIEIQALLSEYDGSSNLMTREEDYINYLSDITLPILPWETQNELNLIIDHLINELNELEIELGIKEIDYLKYKVNNIETLKTNIEILRNQRKNYFDTKKHNELQNIEEIQKCIHSLQNIRNLGDKPSIQLEKWSAMALHALNDAISINPNYPVGDDNEPLFTAPAGKADIECFYYEFNSICEVTMLTGRDQWYNEGQPVMRHLRTFEDTNNDKPSYCIFIAPRMHQDTINTFWFATKYEYEGIKQRIVPLSINQLVKILEILIKLKQANKTLKHTDIKNLFNNVVEITKRVNNSGEWINAIPNVITQWENQII
jgi:hypothetical protein